ncbi:MAG: hypothetical protein Kow0092_04830 [Deferrisomatales bacterium]
MCPPRTLRSVASMTPQALRPGPAPLPPCLSDAGDRRGCPPENRRFRPEAWRPAGTPKLQSFEPTANRQPFHPENGVFRMKTGKGSGGEGPILPELKRIVG